MPTPYSWSGVPAATLSNIVKETMSNQVDNYLSSLSPCWRRVIRDNTSASRADWGRNWQIIKLLRTGLSGTFEFSALDNGSVGLAATTSINSNIYGASAGTTWPGAGFSTAPAYWQYRLSFVRMKGNMHFPAEIRRIDNLNSMVGNQYAAIIESTAQQMAFQLCNAFWADTATVTRADAATATVCGVLGTLTVGGGAGQFADSDWASGTARTGLALTTGSVRRFEDGMRVSLYCWDTTDDKLVQMDYGTDAGAATGPVFVTLTNSLGDTIGLVNQSGRTITAATHIYGTTIYITLPNAIPVAGLHGTHYNTVELTSGVTAQGNLPWGINTVMKNSGYLYGTVLSTGLVSDDGLSLTQHPRFKSYNQTVSAALDESLLLQYASRWQHARGQMFAVDEFWTTEGVFGGYVEGIDGLYTYERNGSRLNAQGGVTGGGENDEAVMTFAAYGKVYKIRTDPFISAGKLYGVVTRNNNWKKYVPPRLPGVKGYDGFDNSIEFIVPMLTGSSEIFQGIKTSAGATTDVLEAPFNYLYQTAADIAPGIVLSSITESIGPTG